VIDPLFAHLVWIVPLALLVAYIGSPRFLGTVGRSRVLRIARSALERRRYTLLHDLNLPAGGGTLHFDLIIVSRFGIHVIDVVHRSGVISGTEAQARWQSRSMWHRKFFENPVHANFLRVQLMERLLQLPLSRFHPIVVFSANCRFKKPMPMNVVPASKLIQKIRADSGQLLSEEEADQAVLRLQECRAQPSLIGPAGRWKLLRLSLLIVLLVGIYFVYGNSMRTLLLKFQRHADVSMAPEKFHADGTPKTEQELWEDGLICAYSVDTDRCACYEQGGGKANIGKGRCRELAERGSVLQR